MILKKGKHWTFILVIFGCFQFIVLTIIAMCFYKGGTYSDPSSTSYLFWYNYFSDLGRSVAHSGVSNKVSFLLFTIALSLWGLSQIPFFIAFPKFFFKTRKLKRISITGSIFGIFTGVCYVGIAFTPSDLIGNLHDLLVLFGFGSIFISLILYSIVIYQDINYPKFYAKILVISIIVLGIYFISFSSVQNANFEIELLISVIGQKIMIYTLLICGIIQGYGALRQKFS
ncbi:MAG: hypothetical protein KAT57_02800 [Candidatus Lokiarchaeota archaeon]|nr:hypothetical protein [Candidatus Lokiarchaeota archaeon]